LEADPPPRQTSPRFHGRVENTGKPCSAPGCEQAGEFRAPPDDTAKLRQDRPPQWRWFCLEHVRAFNAGYNFFGGMSAEEIAAAQRPYAGWDRETRAFSSNATSPPPKWQDFADPLDAVSAGLRERMRESAARADGKALSPEDRKALKVLSLSHDADRKMLRARYTELARRYHPDHNGGDRSHEKTLQDVIAAYTHLRKAPAFA
jgi:DnaJ domain